MLLLLTLCLLMSCSSDEDEDEGDDTFNFEVSDVANIVWEAELFSLLDVEGISDLDINVVQGEGTVTLMVNQNSTFTITINNPDLPVPEIISTGSFVINDGDLFLTFDGASSGLQPFTAFFSDENDLFRLDGGLFFIDLDGDDDFETARLRSRFTR